MAIMHSVPCNREEASFAFHDLTPGRAIKLTIKTKDMEAGASSVTVEQWKRKR